MDAATDININREKDVTEIVVVMMMLIAMMIKIVMIMIRKVTHCLMLVFLLI